MSEDEALARAAADPEGFLESLAQRVRQAVPDGRAELVLERDRTLTDRLTGRAGRPVAARFEGGELVLTLRRAGTRWDGEAARVIGGVVIARQPLQLGQWLDALAGRVAAEATEAAGDAAAARRALATLGLQPARPLFTVHPQHLDQDLRALVADATDRLPGEAAQVVERIARLLRETAPRVAGRSDAEALVRRTACVYLPDTLRTYTALPADWARSHTLLDGSTPFDALLAQLQQLEAAATGMRDAAVADDADALLLNGLFLRERFGPASDAVET